MDDRDPGDGRTDVQREWADWAAHGYRKLYQPRSVRRFGLVFTVVFAAFLILVLVLASRGGP